MHTDYLCHYDTVILFYAFLITYIKHEIKQSVVIIMGWGGRAKHRQTVDRSFFSHTWIKPHESRLKFQWLSRKHINTTKTRSCSFDVCDIPLIHQHFISFFCLSFNLDSFKRRINPDLNLWQMFIQWTLTSSWTLMFCVDCVEEEELKIPWGQWKRHIWGPQGWHTFTQVI